MNARVPKGCGHNSHQSRHRQRYNSDCVVGCQPITQNPTVKFCCVNIGCREGLSMHDLNQAVLILVAQRVDFHGGIFRFLSSFGTICPGFIQLSANDIKCFHNLAALVSNYAPMDHFSGESDCKCGSNDRSNLERWKYPCNKSACTRATLATVKYAI